MNIETKKRFPSPIAEGKMGGLVLGLVLILPLVMAYSHFLPPLQGYYLKQYIKLSVGRTKQADKGKYTVLVAIPGTGANLGRCQANWPPLHYREDKPINQATVEMVQRCTEEAAPGEMKKWLREEVYAGETMTGTLFPVLCVWGVGILAFLIGGAVFDTKRRNKAREPLQIAGPVMLDRETFNKQVNGDGYPFLLENPQTFTERLFRKEKTVRIRAEDENLNVMCMADPGTGKTLILMQALAELARRGKSHVAVVYDPHIQYVPVLYNERRSDIIFNPLDDRCPSWNPAEEIDHSDEATAYSQGLAMGTSLFVGKPSDKNWFFTYCSQLIWAYCLVRLRAADAHALAYLLEHANPLIDIVVKGTELEEMLSHNAAQQRAGVTSHLSQIAFALRQIPKKEAGRRHFVMREYCETRKGWVFLTSTQKTRAALRPLQSLLLDTAIMGFMSMGERGDLPSVTIGLDEAQTLQKLPTLLSLMTEGRKTLRVVMGFQGRSQIKEIYGEETEALLSAAFTKFMMRTSEPEAQEWLSKTVGDVLRERMHETRPLAVGGGNSTVGSEGPKLERLVIPSEFGGFEKRQGIMKYGNRNVKVTIPIIKREPVAQGFIPRPSVPAVQMEIPDLETARKEAADAIAENVYKEMKLRFDAKKRIEEEERAEEALRVAANPPAAPKPKKPVQPQMVQP